MMDEITRTEKFLRACIDGEPCALKPLTRVEKLLAELNDKLAGAPSEVVILPETELESMSGEEGIFFSTNPLSATPTAGATAKVEYNGAEYECSVLSVPEAPFEAYALGNAEMTGIAGGNADAPFLVMLTPSGSENDSYTTCVAMDEASSVTLSIVQTGGEESDDGSGILTVKCVSSTSLIDSNTTISGADKSFSEVAEAYKIGKLVRFIAQYRSEDANCDFVGVVRYAAYENSEINTLVIEFPQNMFATARYSFGFNADGFIFMND